MVDVAHDGADGLWLATSNSYDVVVLDIMIPKLNGYDVCRAMRSAGSVALGDRVAWLNARPPGSQIASASSSNAAGSR